MTSPDALRTRSLLAGFHGTAVLHAIDLTIPARQITAFIGPSGCGKSTLLRCFNRMNDHLSGFFRYGEVLVNGRDAYDPTYPVEELRSRVGMVFQKPNPFPQSIARNVSFGPRMAGVRDDRTLAQLVEESLRRAHLWDEVKDRLDASAFELSGGQQQRLCIARSLASQPEILLLDEPASALDPIATAKLEETILELAREVTIVLVTHNLQQAARVADRTAFLYLGKLIEVGDTAAMFATPREALTQEYLTGRFG